MIAGCAGIPAYAPSRVAAALAWLDIGLPGAAWAALTNNPRPALLRNRRYPFPPLLRTTRFRDGADIEGEVQRAIDSLGHGRAAEAAEALRQLLEPAEFVTELEPA